MKTFCGTIAVGLSIGLGAWAAISIENHAIVLWHPWVWLLICMIIAFFMVLATEK